MSADTCPNGNTDACPICNTDPDTLSGAVADALANASPTFANAVTISDTYSLADPDPEC